MKDQAINEAIAKACGWEYVHQEAFFDQSLLAGTSPDGATRVVPNYCTDLNAMHAAEENIPWTSYMEQLRVADTTGAYVAHRYLWHATARQRAEAFLRTLNLWRDE